MNMNVGDVRKDSKFCKRSMRTIGNSVVQGAAPEGPKESYPVFLRGLPDLLPLVQVDPPEQWVRGGRVPLRGI